MKIGLFVRWAISIISAISYLSMNAQTTTVATQTLTPQQQNLIAISSYTASGNIEGLKGQLAEGLDAGLTINEIKEALTQLYAYCGFPRSLNALNAFKSVLEERKSKGISDKEGKQILVDNTSTDRYEQGRKVLVELTKMPQPKPAPGFGEFAPRIDAFLKEHLFADVFASDVLTYQQRELITISALASMPGVESQLQSHISIGKNTGVTEDQLSQVADIIQKSVNKTQANGVRKIIAKAVVPVIEPDMMVRIAEIEIVPEFLDEYKTILKENAAKSVEKEPGVIAIVPLYEEYQPTRFRIVELYASQVAYQSHLKTSHFQHYKTTTLKMVKDLKLVEMHSVDAETMRSIFQKLK